MDEGRAETTVNRKLSSLRSFYHYLLRQFVGIDKVQLNAEGEVVKADPR